MPLCSILRFSRCPAYSIAGRLSGYGRGDGWSIVAGRFWPRASCGRSSLSMRRSSSNRFCWRSMVGSGGRTVSALSVRCMRSCAPFCSGCPGTMRSTGMPSRIHHSDSRESLALRLDFRTGCHCPRGSPAAARTRGRCARTRGACAVPRTMDTRVTGEQTPAHVIATTVSG
jgi:hypothetical protein